jgi:hypothetical protein
MVFIFNESESLRTPLSDSTFQNFCTTKGKILTEMYPFATKAVQKLCRILLSVLPDQCELELIYTTALSCAFHPVGEKCDLELELGNLNNC